MSKYLLLVSLFVLMMGCSTKLLKNDVPDDAQPNVDSAQRHGFSPLHTAVRSNDIDEVRKLLENGTDPNVRSKIDRSTPLHVAAEEGNAKIASLLIKYGADVEAHAKDGFTPLHVCSKEGKVNVAAVLARHGADFESRDENESTPLHIASKFGRFCMVKFLVEYSDLSNNIPDNCNADEGNIVRYLLEKGSDPNVPNIDGIMPLHIAVALNNIEDAKALLEYGANPNVQTKNGMTPLTIAAKEGYMDMVKLLIQYKADVNFPAKAEKWNLEKTEL